MTEKLTKKETRYLYLMLHQNFHMWKYSELKKKGISRKHAQIYVSAMEKVLRVLESTQLPEAKKFMFMKIDRN